MTVATLDPNATTSSTAAHLVGAANAHTALSDASDSSYVVHDSGQATTVSLTTFSVPAGAIVKQWRIVIRARRVGTGIANAGAAVQRWTGGVYQGTDGIGGLNLIPVAGTSFGDLYSAWRIQSYTQAEIDDLRLQLFSNSDPTVDVQVAEAAVEIMYVAVPVVAVDAVSPDPYTASTIVPITWVNTLDSDGGGQTRYEVKVFDEATYGAGFAGLDPDTDAPYEESGEVVSSSTSTTVGPLENGDTYRVYVRVAQTVGGVAHWSDWDYDEFGMDVDTADVDSVSVNPISEGGRIEVTVTRDSGSEAWELIEVQRSVDAGATWSDVRTATYVDCTGDANTFVVSDYEVPNGRAALYRARATLFSSDLPITGSWVQSSPAAAWTSASCWLKSPTNPSLNTTIRLKTMVEPSRPRSQGVFHVLGSELPIVVSDVLNAAAGVLGIHVDVAGDSPVPLLEETVLLFHPPELWGFDPMYFAPGASRNVRGSTILDPKATWLVDFVEVAAPADPTAGR